MKKNNNISPVEILDERVQAVKELSPNLFKGLTLKEASFLKEYLKDFEGTRAAVRAGWKEVSARGIAYKLLHRPHVAAALEKIQEAIGKRLAWSVEKSALNTQQYLNEARERGQYMAVVGLQRHLDEITKVYQPNLKIDVTQKSSFTVQMVGFAPPKYSDQQAIDVTPKPELPEPEKKSDDGSTEDK